MDEERSGVDCGAAPNPWGGSPLSRLSSDSAAVAWDTAIVPTMPKSVTAGRHWFLRAAASRGVDGLVVQALELLCSELLANAVLHGPEGGTIRLHLDLDGRVLRVGVEDSGAALPMLIHPDLMSSAGRGLAIVDAIATRWGVQESYPTGKIVWCELDLDTFV